MADPNPSSSKADRKTIEKNRRNEMKALYSKLNSLVPRQSPREVNVSLPDQLEAATDYIKKLQINLEKMKQKKNCLKGTTFANPSTTRSSSSTSGGLNLPSIDVRVMGCTLEVVLISGQNCQFMLSEIIRILHEEGAQVVTASFSMLDNMLFHTIHCKINGEYSQDYGAARISERLRKFVNDVC